MYIHMYTYVYTFSNHFYITLGSLWGDFGVTLWSIWGHFRIILGSLWGQFGPAEIKIAEIIIMATGQNQAWKTVFPAEFKTAEIKNGTVGVQRRHYVPACMLVPMILLCCRCSHVAKLSSLIILWHALLSLVRFYTCF